MVQYKSKYLLLSVSGMQTKIDLSEYVGKSEKVMQSFGDSMNLELKLSVTPQEDSGSMTARTMSSETNAFKKPFVFDEQITYSNMIYNNSVIEVK